MNTRRKNPFENLSEKEIEDKFKSLNFFRQENKRRQTKEADELIADVGGDLVLAYLMNKIAAGEIETPLLELDNGGNNESK